MDVRIEVREGGWLRVAHGSLELAVRVAYRDGEARVAAVSMATPDGWTVARPSVYDAVRTAERWASGPVAETLRPMVKGRSALSVADRELLDARHLIEPVRRASWGESPEAEEAHSVALAVLAAPTGPALVLDIPEDHYKPRAFYEAVAGLYGDLAAATHNPAAVIAQANDVGVTTVYAWVKEARRRGLLPPARATERTTDA